jgi:hypothetical protein
MKDICNLRQREDTWENVGKQLWVLQMVGSNLAAPTKNTVRFTTLFSCAVLTPGSYLFSSGSRPRPIAN